MMEVPLPTRHLPLRAQRGLFQLRPFQLRPFQPLTGAALAARSLALSLALSALSALSAPSAPTAEAQPTSEGILPAPPTPPPPSPPSERFISKLLEALVRTLPTEHMSKGGEGLILLGDNNGPQVRLGGYTCALHSVARDPDFQERALEVARSALGAEGERLSTFDFNEWGRIIEGEVRGGRSSAPTLGLFEHISPLAARWFGVLTVSPHTLIAGHRALDLYRVIFQGAARSLAEAHAQLTHEAGLIEAESAAYAEAMRTEYFNGEDYIATRFHGLPLTSTDPDRRDPRCAPPYAEFGFWLRRELDGSRQALWVALERLLKAFDPSYLTALKERRFPSLPRPVLGGALRLDKLTRLYEGLLTSPYEYMFEGEGQAGKLKAGQYQLGVFLGGVHGLLYYSGLMSAVARELKTNDPDWGDPRLLARLSGHPIERPQTPEELQEGRKRPFTYYNPALIQWGIDQLIPPPDLQIGAHSAQWLYDEIFKRFFRLMGASYMYLHRQKDVNAERLEYTLAMLSPDFNALTYLPRRYAGALSEYDRTEFAALQPWGALGFWVRREIDGTAPLLWGGLKVVLGRFDPDFLRALEAPQP
jgi:hypothetical protein